MEERRIILLGKTGSGKSSVGNTIFGERKFTVNNSPNSVTDVPESHTKMIDGKKIRLIDTPGVFDTDLNKSEVSEKFYNCVKDCVPGPHAFLLVLKVERFTKQEKAVVDEINKSFSAEALRFTTVVFTHGDDLKEGQKIEDWVKQNKSLRSLIDKCGGRCHVFDNKHWNNSQDSYRNNQHQVTELLRTIEETVKEKNGKYYSNEFLKFVINNMKKIWSSTKCTSKVLLGALLGVEEFAKGLFEVKSSTGKDTRFSEHVKEIQVLRIIVLGKSGAGKSSLANTIFGEKDLFKVNRSTASMGRWQSFTREVHGRCIKLIDSPGVFDSGPNSPDLSPEIFKCLTECAPGPHAILLLLKVEKFTAQEQTVVNTILRCFSEEALKYSTVVFTHGDQLDEGMKIKDWATQNPSLRSLIDKCGGRCHVFDNKYWNNSHNRYRNNQRQVTQLLRTIDNTVVKNKGGYYTNKPQTRSVLRLIFGF